ncbi:MAG: hypothetical protein KAR21_03005, partial [Spirochaetales bacterium]|nr:hypothetical protein [Spirochaetales bacterium]
VFVFITGCSKSSEETASSPVDHPIVAASAPEISDVPSETEVDVLDMEQEEPVDKAIPPAAVEEPEVPAPPVIVEPPLEVEVSAAEFAYAPGLKELDAFTVSERILNEQKLLADLLKNKPLIINFKINVEYQEPREIVQAAEPEPAVVEVPVVEAPVIETAEPDRPTIVEYRLKDGLVIVVESGPKIAFKPEPASEIDIKSDSIPVLEEEIINPAGSPFIEILSPGNRSFYTKKVQIEGRIANSVNDPESVSEVETATWEIEGEKDPEELVFGSDGVFFLSFSADSYSGILNILIRAEGSENLIARKKLVLFDGNVQPELILTSPENESVYGAALHISGTVTDPSAYDLGLTGPAGMEYS